MPRKLLWHWGWTEYRGFRGWNIRSGSANAAGVSDFVNRKQFNIKIGKNFNSNHRISGSWSYQMDDSADFVAAWPGGLNGETWSPVLTLTGTSTLRRRC
jgi:hypothetical protein